MPGWYIHMEAARKMVDALADQDPALPDAAAVENAAALATAAKRWRNYLAIGAIGPDIFYLLPDFPGVESEILSTALHWVLDIYAAVDDSFLHAWETYVAPVQNLSNAILSEATGDISQTLNDISNMLQSTIIDAILSLIVNSEDWFGIFTSGVPKGYADSAFYWSDMFHYRRTYEFPQLLFQRAQSWVDPATGEADQDTRDKLTAFALGWMSHCAVDVTGHPFVNAKCGGPYRTHWQRHHLIENHMDASAYDAQHGGVEPYGNYDTSGLHFRIAFRKGDPSSPYVDANGTPMNDAPAYDYFTGLPDYTKMAGYTPASFLDLDTTGLPDVLSDLLVSTMLEMWDDGHARPGSGGPKVLLNAEDRYRTGDTGVPSAGILADTYQLLFDYLKFTCKGGTGIAKPEPPSVFPNLDPPLPPGFAPDDPSRGGDDHSFDFWDFLAALFAWPLYLAELGAWFALLGPAVLNDLATYAARDALYQLVEVPLWSAYLASRRALVLAAILIPKHEEIEPGLVTLGIGPGRSLADLRAALDSPDGTGTSPPGFDEPSGRETQHDAYGADPLFPRDVVTDDPSQVSSLFGLNIDKINHWPDTNHLPSEFMRPWAYPDTNHEGAAVAGESSVTHPGPWQQGATASDLLSPAGPANAAAIGAARADFEAARTPTDTEAACDTHLPVGGHLGNPVDYALYLVAKLTGAPIAGPDEPLPWPAIPDFNLDSDRGYGYRCWDWNRHSGPDSTGSWDTFQADEPGGLAANDPLFKAIVPCTPPQGYNGTTDLNGNWVTVDPRYVQGAPLAVHYLSPADPTDPDDPAGADPGCTPFHPNIEGRGARNATARIDLTGEVRPTAQERRLGDDQ